MKDYKLFIILSLGFIIRIFLATQPLGVLLDHFLDDDAFYYFTVAENFVEGKGLVFNEGIPTNGFHPLYLMFLLPIFKVLLPLGHTAPIQGALIFLAICDILTAFFINKIVSRLTNKNWGLVATVLWALNPWIIFTTFTGMEAGLHLLVVAILVNFILKNQRNLLNKRNSIILGFLMGLVFFSRMDGFFVGVGICLWLLKTFKLKDNLPAMLTVVSVASLMALPWILWNVFGVGSFFPISGAARQLIRTISQGKLYWVVGSIYMTFVYITQTFIPVPFTIPLSAIFISLFLLGVFVIPTLIYRKRLFEKLSKIEFMLFALVLHLGFYWFIQTDMRRWYALYLAFFAILLFCLIYSETRLKPSYIIPLLLLIFVFNSSVFYSQGSAKINNLKYELAQNLEEVCSGRPGSFNTGILQYFSDSDVLNLDGVINPQAHLALKTSTIETYFNDHVDCWIDTPGEFDFKKLNRSQLNVTQVYEQPFVNFKKPYMLLGSPSQPLNDSLVVFRLN